MTPTSAVEFLIWLLIAASIIAVLAARLRIPYTVALVIGGLLLGATRLPMLAPLHPENRPEWLTSDVILILFLPALVFEGSVRLNLRELLKDWAPLLLLATAGVFIATFVTGYFIHWTAGMPLMMALLFGAIISATDPISVLAIFKDLKVHPRLTLLIEGESLLNDGTAVVLFQIVLAGIVAGNLSPAKGAGQFGLAVAGGAGLGFVLGLLVSKLTERIDDPQVEITLTTILAYGSYLLAHDLHLSGVIATCAAGLMLGNLGARKGMSDRTRIAMQSFWEYLAFVMNSLVFLLIGLEVRLGDLFHSWHPILLAIAAVLLGRIFSVYPVLSFSNLFTEKIPGRWQHLFIWGGLRGSVALAMALSLDSSIPYRDQILDLTFGVVIFSILVQGLTIKPSLRVFSIERAGAQLQREKI